MAASLLQPKFTDREFTVDHPPTRREAPTGWPIELEGLPRDQMASYLVEQRTLAAINAKGRIVKPKGCSLSEHIARIMCGDHGQPSAYRAIRQLVLKGMVEVERTGDGTSPYRVVTSVGQADQWALDEWAKAHPKRKRKQTVAEAHAELQEQEWPAPEEPEFRLIWPAEEPAFQTCEVCGSRFFGHSNIMDEHMRLEHPNGRWTVPIDDTPPLDAIADRVLHRAAESIAMYDEKCRDLQYTQNELSHLQERFVNQAQTLANALSRTNNSNPQLEANYNTLLEQYATLQAEYDKLKASITRSQQTQRTYNIIESLDDRSREALLSLIEET